MIRALVILLFLAGSAQAMPPFARGGGGGGAPVVATNYACDVPETPNVCAQYHDGQTFVTWDDVGTTGAAGASTRYRVYRSTAPITSGNYTGATLVARNVFNNSAQLFGGTVNGFGNNFTQAARQLDTLPMSKIPDLVNGGLKTLPVFSGLQVYTALATESAYYAVVSTDIDNANPVYISSAGPVAESVATPAPVMYSHSTTSAHKIVSPAGKPFIFEAHASAAAGGCPAQCGDGDYLEWWLTPAEGWQDGRATTLNVMQDNGFYLPAWTDSIRATTRDTMWTPRADGSIESQHQGLGMKLPGGTSRYHRITAKGISRMLSWAISYYGVDPNQVYWVGQSMGAWGGATTGMHSTAPQFAAIWLNFPLWRPDLRTPSWWPGVGWNPLQPFVADLGASPNFLGTVKENVPLDDGTSWTTYANIPAFVEASIGDDLPMVFWNIGKNDDFVGIAEHITTSASFATGRLGYAWTFQVGGHEGAVSSGVISCNTSFKVVGLCYPATLFKLNTPYLALSNSSIDDNPGTGSNLPNGMRDGDWTGGVNIGFSWTFSTDTAGALSFTVDNDWMQRSPTVHPATTTTSAIAVSGLGTFTFDPSTPFIAPTTNRYYLVNGLEIFGLHSTTGITSGNVFNPSQRGLFGTTAQAHAAGVPIQQFIMQPTGPTIGPQTSMTVDITPRRLQGFVKPAGTVVNCTVTPNGAAGIAKSGTVVGAKGVFTLTGIPINETGPTNVSCS